MAVGSTLIDGNVELALARYNTDSGLNTTELHPSGQPRRRRTDPWAARAPRLGLADWF
jgi:hypothetical protein